MENDMAGAESRDGIGCVTWEISRPRRTPVTASSEPMPPTRWWLPEWTVPLQPKKEAASPEMTPLPDWSSSSHPGVLLRPSKMTSDFFLPRPLRNGHRCIIAFETISASRGDEPCRHCRGGRDWSHVQVGMVLARAARLTVRHRPSRERLLGEQLHRRLRGGGPKLTVFDLL
jgi:hypothetical protein